MLTAPSVPNAAVHWILGELSARINTRSTTFDALKPGGKFIFEMDDTSNVVEISGAMISPPSTLDYQGPSLGRVPMILPVRGLDARRLDENRIQE